ncbi:Deoxyribodipyrimidine photo-lyase [Pseudorhizobium banfieldiae]|uniref:Deoxyribodipyrimidine photo-lyase n=1 Tax=Pseudorhizobium banfieldiae TaxID=1125847 RepID=L0NF97_9HYPH|nr:deoxyribodipyrimidine photo-lyase [Pseudorhizobium banfieldiae]CAD6608673.1 deoxyribodipyrimidine photo-lyase [arsenite-oxidising bacterium NT-25]CCF19491.1 Deoxyribodipyrimidine photo-lyase [Pseudorhizobium banfieldiae]
MPAEIPPVIVWFRRDLRLADNAALSAAVETGAPVIALFIREGSAGGGMPFGAAQAWWLHHSLLALRQALHDRGGDLLFFTGEAATVLVQVAQQTGANQIYLNRSYERDDQDRDIARRLKAEGIAVHAFHGQLLHDPSHIRTGGGKPFRVFTPFWKALQALGEPREPLAAPDAMRGASSTPPSEQLEDWGLLPTKPDWAAGFGETWTPGEAGARFRLEDFVEHGLREYKSVRDFPARDLTSHLSPHLAHGEVTPAQAWHAASGLDNGDPAQITHFRRELAWRDFNYSLLIEFPRLATDNWNTAFDGFAWSFDGALYRAWRKGLTGYPIVDAGMRQLWREGYMHNRVRMITASFLIKDLTIDWRKGEEWFRETLLDADPANNAASWQWVAGSGADASPFFRIFNPTLQGEKFDPDGDYVRRYVPELSHLDKKYIHRPFEAPDHILQKAGIRLGESYPRPIVDHGSARERALAAYKATR